MINYQCTFNIQKGFSLVELIIVVIIIGILVSIAYPSYTKYIIKSNRTAMMTDLQNIANRIQAQKIASGSYSTITLESIYGTPATAGMAKFPITGTPLYTVKIYSEDASEIQMAGVNMTSGNWKLKANPLPAGIVAEDGIITLDSAGIKCRSTTCGAGSEWNP